MSNQLSAIQDTVDGQTVNFLPAFQSGVPGASTLKEVMGDAKFCDASGKELLTLSNAESMAELAEAIRSFGGPDKIYVKGKPTKPFYGTIDRKWDATFVSDTASGVSRGLNNDFIDVLDSLDIKTVYFADNHDKTNTAVGNWDSHDGSAPTLNGVEYSKRQYRGLYTGFFGEYSFNWDESKTLLSKKAYNPWSSCVCSSKRANSWWVLSSHWRKFTRNQRYCVVLSRTFESKATHDVTLNKDFGVSKIVARTGTELTSPLKVIDGKSLSFKVECISGTQLDTVKCRVGTDKEVTLKASNGVYITPAITAASNIIVKTKPIPKPIQMIIDGQTVNFLPAFQSGVYGASTLSEVMGYAKFCDANGNEIASLNNAKTMRELADAIKSFGGPDKVYVKGKPTKPFYGTIDKKWDDAFRGDYKDGVSRGLNNNFRNILDDAGVKTVYFKNNSDWRDTSVGNWNHSTDSCPTLNGVEYGKKQDSNFTGFYGAYSFNNDASNTLLGSYAYTPWSSRGDDDIFFPGDYAWYHDMWEHYDSRYVGSIVLSRTFEGVLPPCHDVTFKNDGGISKIIDNSGNNIPFQASVYDGNRLTFKLECKADMVVETVKFQVGTGREETLTASNGIYTTPAITAASSIIVKTAPNPKPIQRIIDGKTVNFFPAFESGVSGASTLSEVMGEAKFCDANRNEIASLNNANSMSELVCAIISFGGPEKVFVKGKPSKPFYGTLDRTWDDTFKSNTESGVSAGLNDEFITILNKAGVKTVYFKNNTDTTDTAVGNWSRHNGRCPTLNGVKYGTETSGFLGAYSHCHHTEVKLLSSRCDFALTSYSDGSYYASVWGAGHMSDGFYRDGDYAAVLTLSF